MRVGVSRRRGQLLAINEERLIRCRAVAGGYDDWVAFSIFAVGVLGATAMLAGPVSIATWILLPFVASFIVFGLFILGLRITRRDQVTIDLEMRTVSTLRVKFSYTTRPVVEVHGRKAYAGNGISHRVSDIQVTNGKDKITLITHLTRHDAELIAARFRSYLAEHLG